MEKSIEELKKENQSLWRQIGGYKVQNKNYRNTVVQLKVNLADLEATNQKLRADCSDLKSKYDKIISLPWYKRIFGF